MRKMTTAGCNAGGHLQFTSVSLWSSNPYERRPKRSSRLGAGTGCDEIACEQLPCSVMCGKPSEQARKRAIACVRNRLSSLARIASKESQRPNQGHVGLFRFVGSQSEETVCTTHIVNR